MRFLSTPGRILKIHKFIRQNMFRSLLEPHQLQTKQKNTCAEIITINYNGNLILKDSLGTHPHPPPPPFKSVRFEKCAI